MYIYIYIYMYKYYIYISHYILKFAIRDNQISQALSKMVKIL